MAIGRTAAVAVALTSLLATTATAAPRGTEYTNPTPGRAVALQIPGMHLAKVKRNLVYRRSAEGPLRMDVYSPRSAKPGGRLPAVLFVHGISNSLNAKDADQFLGWGQLAAASGLVGITFTHRHGWAGPDTKSAIAYVRANARKLGVDGGRLAVQAHSWDAADAVGASLAGAPDYLRALVVYYGLMSTSNPALSPESYVQRNPESIPPILIVKAGREVRDINADIDRFVAAAAASGVTVTVVTQPAGKHSFDTLQHTPISRQIMRATLTFLRANLGA